MLFHEQEACFLIDIIVFSLISGDIEFEISSI